ncbi:hypothetical protein F5Y17DRAFT_472826 [Xylariaceae sp. FL0594]|nr:hypothetical protein F5Y17DRAFT_472826 [Xylariaceae sp. FL0594]
MSETVFPKGVKGWSILPARLYQPIKDKSEEAHVCPACFSEKPASRSARLHILSMVLGFLGLLLGGYASLQIGACHQDSTVRDHFIPTPTFPRLFVEDRRFVDSDLHDGFWNFDGNSKELRTPWDEVFAGAWIEIAHPADYGLKGGLPMSKYYNGNVSPESEAYVPSVFHQIHCVGEIKHAIIALQNGRELAAPEHVNHCVEYLRQAVLCSGDLTLERPLFVGDTAWTPPNGWGFVHQCRDLSGLYALPQANFSSVVSRLQGSREKLQEAK